MGFPSCAPLTALLVVLLAAAAGPAAGRGSRRRLLVPPPPADAKQPAPAQQHPVPPEFIISNATLGSFLKHVASPNEHAIIFTTTRLPDKHPEGEIAMMSNFCSWLDKTGVLGHTMLLTTDNATWHALNARGFPVVLDRVFPERQEYRDGKGSAPDTPNRVFDVQKHYWGSTLIAHGFRALYMDSDAIVLQNPLEHFHPDYDVQGLSDWSGPELPRVGEVLHRSCGLYALVPDHRVGVGSMVREWWRYGPGDKERALTYANPCQSTGAWYLEPTPMAQRFMAAMRDRLLAPATRHQWDQTAWNEVIIPHLWGSGDEPPLRYRLLPPRSFFGGVGNYESRLEAGLPVDPVILHSGGLHGGAKQATYERLGLFHADFSLPARPRPGAVGTHGLPEHRQQQWQNATAAAAAAAAGQAAQEAKVAASAGLGFRGLVAPQHHPTVLALAGLLALLGAAGCAAGLVFWRRARAQQARRPLIKGLPTRPPGDD